MLEKLKAKLGMTEAVASITDENLQASFEASEAKVLSLTSQLAEYDTVLSTMEAKLDAAQASLVKYAEMAAQAEAAQAEMIAQAAAAKNEARMSQLSHAVGDVKAAALFGSFGNVDDASFAVLVESLQMSLDKEANSEMFQEKGVEGSEAEVAPVSNGDRLLSKIKTQKTKGTK